ncbi:MAG: hypothetical protein DHS20C16_21770 [Phycisphaerae bacterium]|nr:MAG: hypothetical protein DHS20C16_21770 [Phycisphaerae bacterium]
MDLKALQDFRSHDWADIASKLLTAAPVLATRYGWNRNSILPKGKTLEDVVEEAIADIWENPDRRNPEISVVTQLKGIVRHKLWNLSQNSDGRVARSDLDDHPDKSSAPEATTDLRDEFEHVIDLLMAHPKVSRSPDLELLVVALGAGITDVPELAQECGVPASRIYQLQRELRAIYPSIARRLNVEEVTHE